MFHDGELNLIEKIQKHIWSHNWKQKSSLLRCILGIHTVISGCRQSHTLSDCGKSSGDTNLVRVWANDSLDKRMSAGWPCSLKTRGKHLRFRHRADTGVPLLLSATHGTRTKGSRPAPLCTRTLRKRYRCPRDCNFVGNAFSFSLRRWNSGNRDSPSRV